MTRILFFGASPNLTVGYGKVIKYLRKGLAEHFGQENIFTMGLQTIGRIDSDPQLLPLGEDVYGTDILPIYIKEHEIDILITFVDNWSPEYHFIKDVVKATGVKWICHTTIFSVPMPYLLYDAIKEADHFVAPSEFVKEQLELAGHGLKNNTCIYHGVNCDVFKPGEKKIDTGCYNFVAIGTNKQSQKNWMGLLKAMRHLIFKLGETNVRLFIVTETGFREGLNFDMALMQSGLKPYVILVPVIRNIGLNESALAEVINSCDCYVSASYGESFSLPLLESFACGKPAIATGFSAMKELIDRSGAGLPVDLLGMIQNPLITEQALINHIDMAEKMQMMIHLTPEEKETFSKSARSFAESNDWKIIIPQWIKLIEELEKPKLDYINGGLGI